MSSSDSSATNDQSPALFSTFVMGLASATLIELGLVDDPVSKKKRKNKESARQHISLLEMLKDKTRGNLGSEEAQLLDRVLTDLKLQYARSV